MLRIFIGESDRMDGRPLYEWLVTEAKSRGMAGATVLRGMMGFGAHSKVIHTFKIERLSEDLPIVIEIVDSKDRIEDFLAHAENRIRRGMLASHGREGAGAGLSRWRGRRVIYFDRASGGQGIRRWQGNMLLEQPLLDLLFD